LESGDKSGDNKADDSELAIVLTVYRKKAISSLALNAPVHVVFYQEPGGDALVVEWLRELNATNPKA